MAEKIIKDERTEMIRDVLRDKFPTLDLEVHALRRKYNMFSIYITYDEERARSLMVRQIDMREALKDIVGLTYKYQNRTFIHKGTSHHVGDLHHLNFIKRGDQKIQVTVPGVHPAQVEDIVKELTDIIIDTKSSRRAVLKALISLQPHLEGHSRDLLETVVKNIKWK